MLSARTVRQRVGDVLLRLILFAAEHYGNLEVAIRLTKMATDASNRGDYVRGTRLGLAATYADGAYLPGYRACARGLRKLALWDDARVMYEAGLARGASNAEGRAGALLDLGALECEVGNLPAAVANYRKALILVPHRVDIAEEITRLLALMDEPADGDESAQHEPTALTPEAESVEANRLTGSTPP